MKHVLTVFSLFISFLALAGNGKNYQAPRAQVAPTIDGNGSDACWSSATWYDVSYLWLGVQPSAADFTGKFKVTWNANKLFVLAEITDDVLSDNYANPLSNYWEDDTWEIFLDENHSGGEHENNYNAFAYHISTLGDIVDSDLGSPRLFNSHATVSRTKNGTTYTWEASFDVYTDAYVYATGTANPKATLTLGKQMGFAMAYCDNDGGTTRQSFIGSEDVPGTNKNVAYQNATVFGNLELVETSTPTFSQILINNTGFNNPTVMTMLPDGRILIGQQAGTVKIVKNGALLTGNALSIPVDASGGDYTERGLIGITADPNFATNGYVYIFYTTTVGSTHNKVSRFKMTGDVIDPSSEILVTDLDALSTATNHNGGALHFGLDGKLYIATGENGTPANAQNLTVTHGKLLRLNADGTIPSDNPYATDANPSKRKVWQYGLRNPFTFDVQPGTGKLFINDVGQDAWEEINDGTVSNKNFGWPNVEGVTTITTYANPVYTYNHGSGNTEGCAITGGCFFNPASTNYPSKYLGKYFFMDYCGEWMDVMDPVTGLKTERFIANVIGSYPVAVDVAADGNLYYLTRNPAALYKVAYSGSSMPDIVQNPASQTAAASQPALFTVKVAGVKPFTYKWQKNGADIPGAVDSTFRINVVTAADAGSYRVIISNTYGADTSSAAVLTVTAFNSKPTVTFTTAPANNSSFTGGQAFSFVATATDPQDGLLPASAFSWHFDLHHNTHVHDGLPSNGVKSFNVTIPTTGHTDTDIYYKIYVVVKDAGGLTDTAYVNLLPALKNITLKTVPAGLTVKLDDEPVATPNTQKTVVGVVRTLDVVLTQSYQGKVYSFTGWSNGGPANQTYASANRDTTFTALFQETQVTKDSIAPIHDAFAQYTSYEGTHANITYGATTPNELVVKNFSATPNRQTYIMFNLNNLLGSATDISSVKLKLYGGLSTVETGANTIKVIAYEGASNLWTENAVTWNNKPEKLNIKYDSVTVTNLSPADQYFYLDLTTLIKAKVAAGQNLVTVVLVTPNDNAKRVIFQSKENPGGKGPALVVSYAANCNAVITSPGTSYCTGSSVTLSANTGTGFTYKWYKDAVQITGASAATYPAAVNGSYTVQVTNAAGCFKVSNTVLITQATAPAASVTSPKTAFCTGDSILITANTGTGLTYVWYNNTTVISGATASTYKAKTAGVYTVEVQNTSLCKKPSNAITLTENVLPAVSITAPATALCAGDSIVLTATGSNSTYQWYKNTVSISGATLSTYKAKTAGSYTVEVSNANACKKLSAAVTITENALPTAAITSPKTVMCTGDSITLTATTAAGLTYKWFRAGVLITGATASTYKGKTAGSYSVEITNTTGCKKVSNILTLSETVLPTATLSSPVSAICSGDSVLLTANAATGFTYKWFKNTVLVSGSSASTYKAKTGGSYYVEVTNATGCKKNAASLTITENSLPSVTLTAPAASFCSGSPVTLSSSTGTTYKWMLDNTPVANAASATLVADTPGSYTVEISNENGCKKISTPVVLTENNLPVAEIHAVSTSFCSGSSLELTSSTGSSYQWYNSDGLISGATNAAYISTAGGPFYVEVTSSQNCKKTSEPKILTVVNAVIWYADADGDGAGAASETISSCTQPAGYASVADDLCPVDADKTEPGTCGCGIPEGDCISTDVTDALNGKSFVLFPNPVTQTGLYFSSAISGSVYDAKGSLVASFTHAESIDTSTLENGLYIIHTSSGDNYKFYIAR